MKTKIIIPISLITIYFIFFVLFEGVFLKVDGRDVSIIMFLGFAIVIIAIFIFVNLNHQKKPINFKFYFVSENMLKILLLILMSIAFFIPPLIHSETIIIWKEIWLANYFRAFIFIIGCTYLPGASIYNIFFNKSKLHERFKVEPLILKLTFYPLLSLGFLGSSIIIFDQLGLFREQMETLFFIIMIILFFIDIILQKRRKNPIKLKLIKIKISRNSLIILLLAIGISTISIGFQFGWKYIHSGDPWDVIKYANYMGKPWKSPTQLIPYPNFWAYVVYGLSTMCGLPFINVNTLLAPFNYLFILAVYLFIKSILSTYKTKYSILATIFVSGFSGIFIVPLVSTLVYSGNYHFIYKSYSYFLFFISLALFFIVLNYKSNENYEKTEIRKISELKILSLGAFFLIISFMTYSLPLLLGLLFLFLFCLFSEKRKKFRNFSYFIFFLLFIIAFFFIFDVIQYFYLNHTLNALLMGFFSNEITYQIVGMLTTPKIIYPLLLAIIFIIYVLNKVFFKRLEKKETIKRKHKTTYLLIFIIILLVFVIFSLIEFSSMFLEKYILNIELSNEYFFFLFLDMIYLNIGFIGILGIFLSYYCFKRSRNLFFILFAWILLSFIISFLLIYFEMVINSSLTPIQIPNYRRMIHWFNRNWYYSIPPLSILLSIGIFEIIKKYKHTKLINKKRFFRHFLKNVTFLGFILFSFTGIIQTGILYGNSNLRHSDARIKTLNWVSENIPLYSNILIGCNEVFIFGIDSIAFVNSFYFSLLFNEADSESIMIQKIEFLKTYNIKYFVWSSFFIAAYMGKNVASYVSRILIPNFYNYTLFSIRESNISVIYVFYAPYFS